MVVPLWDVYPTRETIQKEPNMKMLVMGFIAVVVAVANSGCANQGSMADKPMASTMAAPMHKDTACFACPKCEQLAMQPGKCPKCGADMTAVHLLAVKEGAAYICACGAECKCKMPAEGMKCSCGKDITKVSLKGKYVCSGEGMCPTISDTPGKCPCGKDLKLVE